MVAGKVRMAMGFQKSPANRKQDTPPKPPSQHLPASPSTSGKSETSSQKPVYSRSFGVYFPRSSAQVQPRPPDNNVNDLLRLVEELRERESLLKTELISQKLFKESISIIPTLEKEISGKNEALDAFTKKVETLEKENERLTREVEEIRGKSEEQKRENDEKLKRMEEEIIELRKTASNRGRGEVVIGNESEDQFCALSASQRFQGLMEVTVKSNLIKNLKRNGSFRFSDLVMSNAEALKNNEGSVISSSTTSSSSSSSNQSDSKIEEAENERPRHSRCNSEELAESTLSHIRSRAPRVPKPPPKRSALPTPTPPTTLSRIVTETKETTNNASLTEKSIPPPPPPPKTTAPRPAFAKTAPPPPPPPPKGSKAGAAKVRKVPEVMEFYHSLMRRDSRKETTAAGSAAELLSSSANARDMIGEIENRSAHLLAIKTDVEIQGDFIRFLINEVKNAAFTDIEDVVPFVKWLDDELSYLVDERAVLKHFDWPEQKADALREAAFGYSDLKKLEIEASSFRDDARQPCSASLKKMQALLEKLEHGVYNLSRMRESAATKYKSFQIPTDWMLESGIASQVKLASVKLAMKYMKRVSAELETVGGSGPEEEELIVLCVRFAFRVHQFAGGFDAETMRAFQELRDKAKSCHIQWQNQHSQRFLCRSTTC